MEVEPTASTTTSNIDEGLYSRQLYVLNHADMKKITSSDVLLIGLKGLGAEIAKNLILAGVRSLTIHDEGLVELADLSAQCFLTEKDVGKPRAHACVERLAELNGYVSVSAHTGPLHSQPGFISNFSVVVVTEANLSDQIELNQLCRKHGVKFIVAQTRGLCANVFCDMGNEHIVHDSDGETPFTQMIASVTQDEAGVVTIVDDRRLPLETGNYVKFIEVKGMTQLNSTPPRPIKVLGPYTFSIENTTHYDRYEGGGYVIEVKQPKTMQFLSLEESLKEPRMEDGDLGKFGRPAQLHVGFIALELWRQRHNNHLPGNLDHAKEVVQVAQDFNQSNKLVEELDEDVILKLAFGARGEIAPMVSFIGGIAAQEVLKACSGKFTPIHQWFYFDALEALPSITDPLQFAPEGSRYDSQIAVLGKDLQRKIEMMIGSMMSSHTDLVSAVHL